MRGVKGGAGLLLPDEGGQRGKAHFGVDAAIGVKNRRAQPHEAKAAAALPVHGLADAALLAIQHLLQARQAVRGGVLAHFDADPAPAHLVGDGGRGAGAEETVQNQVAGVGGDVEDALDQPFGFGGAEAGFATEKNVCFFFCFIGVTYFFRWPPCPGSQPRYF